MRRELDPILTSAGLLCRNVVVALLSGWLTGRSFDEVERRLSERPVAEQALITGATLLALFLLALLAAQGGLIGLCLYGLGIVIVAR